MDTQNEREWFEDWFDSPYYHILYQNRNEKEAELFIDSLIRTVPITPNSKILDLACGRGRHSYYLNQLGHDVKGVDLSQSNIKCAQRFNNDRLSFEVLDMRDPLPKTQPDYVINLFTSFGYFIHEQDDIKVLKNVHRVLNSTGKFIIDYLNVNKTIQSLGGKEKFTLDNFDFDVERIVKKNFIVKHIQVNHNGRISNFKEMVKILRLTDFEAYFRLAGFVIDQLYGDYKMNPYEQASSDRLLMVVNKI